MHTRTQMHTHRCTHIEMHPHRCTHREMYTHRLTVRDVLATYPRRLTHLQDPEHGQRRHVRHAVRRARPHRRQLHAQDAAENEPRAVRDVKPAKRHSDGMRLCDSLLMFFIFCLRSTTRSQYNNDNDEDNASGFNMGTSPTTALQMPSITSQKTKQNQTCPHKYHHTTTPRHHHTTTPPHNTHTAVSSGWPQSSQARGEAPGWSRRGNRPMCRLGHSMRTRTQPTNAESPDK